MNAQQSSGLSAKVRGMWARNRDLLRNAGSLAATTGLTSVFGFVFTIVAAHSFSTDEVGWGNAAINMAQLFGTIGMFGLGTMLIGELPKRQTARGGLFAASLSVSAIGSAILALVAAVVVGLYFTRSLPGVGGSAGQVLLFVAGAALTGSTLVFDEGTIGLLRGGVQLWRNMAMSAIKLAALPIAAVALHDKLGVGLSLAYVIGVAGSMIPAGIMLVRGGSKVMHRPDWKALRRLLPVAINHNWLNLALATPGRIIPIVVTVVAGGTGGAVFYVAWMIASLLFMVPIHLGTVLFALASASPDVVAEKLRFVLRVSLLIGLPVMAALAIGAHFMLNIYNPVYAQLGTVPLWLLIIGYIPQMASAQYIAVSRATGKVGRAAGLLCFFACLSIAAIIVGGKLGGLNGLSFAYLGVLTVQGLATAPTVLRAAYASTKAATGEFPAVTAEARATGAMAAAPLARMTGELVRLTGALPAITGTMPAASARTTGVRATGRQESGLAALLSIAKAAVTEGQALDVATEVWRTGAFPALTAEPLSPKQRANAMTTYDMFGGQPLDAPPEAQSYHHRQQAGIDALLAMATPEDSPAEPAERTERPSPARGSRNGA